MNLNDDQALKVAEFLLQIKAVKLRPKEPFTWASGIKSPIYCDNRVTLSYPSIRTFIRQAFSSVIQECFGKPDVIAGVATGGIPQGVLVAQDLGLPFIYVRSEAKAHGMGNQVEGFYEAGQKVVLIEDLISTGGSSLKAVDALRNEGLEVKGLAAIFTYGFEEAVKRFAESGCPFVTLTDYDFLIKKALSSKLISDGDLESLKAWRENPETWNQ